MIEEDIVLLGKNVLNAFSGAIYDVGDESERRHRFAHCNSDFHAFRQTCILLFLMYFFWHV